MATIGSYTAAATIDAANDYLLIQTSGVYKKINRNILLGLSSAPLGTTDSQSPTNKTLDNTNTITLKDTLFTLQDDGDTSKQARFQLSGITTATTRTLTLPDANITLVGTAATQTLTNKTITSPTITGGTIDNSTITVDSIAGHSVATTVTVANLQIANGVLNSANAVTATSVADGAIQPKALITGTGSGWAWSSWVPVWQNLTVGNGTVTAKYIQIGKAVFCRLWIVFGTTTAISGQMQFTMPVGSISYAVGGTAAITLGFCNMEDTGISNYSGFVTWISASDAAAGVYNASSTYLGKTSTSATVPFTWGTGDSMACEFFYEAA